MLAVNRSVGESSESEDAETRAGARGAGRRAAASRGRDGRRRREGGRAAHRAREHREVTLAPTIRIKKERGNADAQMLAIFPVRRVARAENADPRIRTRRAP
jgi:hypothetical protein